MTSRVAVFGAAVTAIVCCVGLPAIAAALGGVSAGALIGGVAGLAITAAVVVAATGLNRTRHRRTHWGSRR